MKHIICMVRDGDKYLVDFISYHLNLVDMIWFIDHSSINSVKRFETSKIKVFRCNFKAQFQGEVVTLIARNIKNTYKSGWLFILDIDEFLPFTNKYDFNKFLLQKSNYAVSAFNWINGFCYNFEENNVVQNISESSKILFTTNLNPNQKVFCNLSKLSNKLSVMTGGHGITDLLNGKRKIIKPHLSGNFLYHILCATKQDFINKIFRYVDQMKYRKQVKGIGGWIAKDYLNNKNISFLDTIAFFRSSIFKNISSDYELCFIDIFHNSRSSLLFKHFLKMNIMIKELKHQDPRQTFLENKYINYKTDDNDIENNIKWFKIINKEIILDSI